MFTGIIESLGTITDVQTEGTNRHFTVATPFAHELQIDQSVAHDGVCLTVVDKDQGWFAVDISAETLSKTNIGADGWAVGRRLNLERALRVGDELGGHIVSGHVDGVAQVVEMHDHEARPAQTKKAPKSLQRQPEAGPA